MSTLKKPSTTKTYKNLYRQIDKIVIKFEKKNKYKKCVGGSTFDSITMRAEMKPRVLFPYNWKRLQVATQQVKFRKNKVQSDMLEV
jgi:hypothetical protein